MGSKYDYGNLNDHDLRALAIEELRDDYKEPTDNEDKIRRHMATIRGRPFVVRWACTHVPDSGWRGLSDQSQGRFMYATQDEAQHRLDCFLNKKLNNEKMMKQLYGKHYYETAEVRPVQCYQGHYDPKVCGFEICPEFMGDARRKEYEEIKAELPDYGLPHPLQSLFIWSGGKDHCLDKAKPLHLKYKEQRMRVRQMHPLSDTERWGNWNPEVELLELDGPDGSFSVYMRDWHWLGSWAGETE